MEELGSYGKWRGSWVLVGWVSIPSDVNFEEFSLSKTVFVSLQDQELWSESPNSECV